MSILFGIHAADGSPASEAMLHDWAISTARYATGPGTSYVKTGLGMAWQPYGSHPRFSLESGPVRDEFQNVLTFDGRLDNSRELAEDLGLHVASTSDSQIALTAFAHWGPSSFRRFTGDWAVAVWSECTNTIYLARDHAGTRTLYYRAKANELRWATYLDTFFSSTESPTLSEPYIAAYLAGQQIGELTPYQGIFAVPPGCSLAIRSGAIRVERHWSPLGESELAYSSEEEYDEHFLMLFRQAIERRTEDAPHVLAELSGGMDSTAIVCMSDHCQRKVDASAPLLDTVSYFDDEEPSLDERRYFSHTETYRGKVGVHLDMSFSQKTFLPHDATRGRYLLPGADSLSIRREEQFHERVWRSDFRAILSGIGGDELLGGVPDRYPELASYLVEGAWASLLKQSLAWSLVNRDPIVETLLRTVGRTARLYCQNPRAATPPPWLAHRTSGLRANSVRTPFRCQDLVQYTPRQLENARTWTAVMGTLPHSYPRILARPEYRYPYLDKDLVNFLLRVPASQLLRPGRRRFMMRRALVGIVPDEILERKRKAFQVTGPLRVLQRRQSEIESLFRDCRLAQQGFIEMDPFAAELKRCCNGQPSDWQAILRTIALEIWSRSGESIKTEEISEPNLAR
ncbi:MULTISPECIES: asparagine synthase-related protein [Acidobacterium]|uniref:asparagine synthase (glutamine-hydrolyzing) n=1 Tax=Acidobacterium capsulatum (strain ATCC 51196 / DSM 11244 / BCRC 80197 / JCM 7670 / NBRC 15755 / NCIMB 13165 / 161) TaxID=240015 RepID=C1F5P2_ACIC5|nr:MULTISPECIES: asparagine synthase-related protein [Acidobacterium]ACO32390.1 asparagine synthetase family [Acidobacterium capsulatum ATCC 51196]HCT60451.1 asparagine synthase [Acidobacterium sp.]